MALKVIVPSRTALAASGIDFDSLRLDRLEMVGDLAETLVPNGEVLLGRLAWSEEELGWVTNWAMFHDGRPIRWQVRGVNFDAAFRNAIYGAAQLMSGNGEPQHASSAGADEQVRR
jgi:hypothetical protein